MDKSFFFTCQFYAVFIWAIIICRLEYLISRVGINWWGIIQKWFQVDFSGGYCRHCLGVEQNFAFFPVCYTFRVSPLPSRNAIYTPLRGVGGHRSVIGRNVRENFQSLNFSSVGRQLPLRQEEIPGVLCPINTINTIKVARAPPGWRVYLVV